MSCLPWPSRRGVSSFLCQKHVCVCVGQSVRVETFALGSFYHGFVILLVPVLLVWALISSIKYCKLI